MKTFRALMLILALSVCTYADGVIPYDRNGNIPNGKTGVIPNGKTATPDVVTTITWQLLQSMLPLF
jgi:hypothetical protein